MVVGGGFRRVSPENSPPLDSAENGGRKERMAQGRKEGGREGGRSHGGWRPVVSWRPKRKDDEGTRKEMGE